MRSVAEVVFIGQGEQHSLTCELVSQSVLSDAQRDSLFAVFEQFIRLRERLGVEPSARDLAWTNDRLGLLRAELPSVAAHAKDTPLARLADSAEQQVRAEKDRSNAIGAIQSKLVGSISPRPELETMAGAKFDWNELQGKVTVFHFWEYRDTPLEEPYGQVAYLDFLQRRHGVKKMQVYGVVTGERVNQPDTRRAGVQSARRLHTFMNLSFPLLVDISEGIKQFGDPRVTGARLPSLIRRNRLDGKGHSLPRWPLRGEPGSRIGRTGRRYPARLG
jgi:hypothetical protein